MANTFLRKVSRNIGNTAVTVGSYTVGANIGAVVVGLSVANTTGSEVRANVSINNGANDFYIVKSAPILDSSTLILVGNDQKIVLQTGDSIKVTSSDGPSLDVLMTVMETEGVGITDDSGGGGGGPTAAFDATDPTDFTFITYGPPWMGNFPVIIDAGSPLHAFLLATDITGYTVDVYEGSTVFSQTVISSINPSAQYWEITVNAFSTETGTATRLVFFAP